METIFVSEVNTTSEISSTQLTTTKPVAMNSSMQTSTVHTKSTIIKTTTENMVSTTTTKLVSTQPTTAKAVTETSSTLTTTSNTLTDQLSTTTKPITEASSTRRPTSQISSTQLTTIKPVAMNSTMTLNCTFFRFDLATPLACTLTITYSCFSPQVIIDYIDGQKPELVQLAPSPQLGIYNTSVLQLSRLFRAAGTFGVIPRLICDNLTVYSQRIISVSDGKSLKLS